MAYEEFLAERILRAFREKGIHVEAKKMMGGICYLVNDKMCAGIVKNKLMARIDPAIHDECLKKKGCHEMDFTGRPMKGFVFVDPEGIDTEDELSEWIQICLDYNPKAKSSKKRDT
jgi:TfoX/Sxy family transcriptional regulator of competence genes